MERVRRFGKKVSDALREAIARPQDDDDGAKLIHQETDARIAELRSLIEDRQAELSWHRRRAEEYFELVQKMEQQRDEWRELYKRDASGHQNAQYVLQDAVIFARTQLARVLTMLNAYRTEKGEPPITQPLPDPRDPPVGTADKTKVENDRVAALMQTPEKKDIDGGAAREAIREKFEAEKPASVA